MTQTRLAERLGTTRFRVSAWENGARVVPVQVAAHMRTLEKLMKYQRRNRTKGDPK